MSDEIKDKLESMFGIKFITLEEYIIGKKVNPIAEKIHEKANLWGIPEEYRDDFTQMIFQSSNMTGIYGTLTLILKDLNAFIQTCPLACSDLIMIKDGIEFVFSNLKEMIYSQVSSVVDFVKDVDFETIWKDVEALMEELSEATKKRERRD